ncbi:MAG: hypothetical protein CMH56_13025 [Myxococcales bacterium]|nr:hypothetical protein [Myxococcales bacterium]
MQRFTTLKLASFVFGLLVTASCWGPGADDTNDDSSIHGEPEPIYGEDQVVTVFEREHVYFGDENRRQVDTTVTMPPADHLFESVTMTVMLSCPMWGGPTSRCDAWDRYGWLAVVENAGEEEETVIEFWRFITPYGVGGQWEVDITDLRPLFSGDLTFRVFIDTWVGPGHESGDGWAVDLAFDYKGGTPEQVPVAVLPVWTSHSFVYGDPAVSVDPAAQTTLTLPEGVSKGTLRVLVTGHGQGNAENCAEFCAKTHTVTAGDVSRPTLLWRDDCAETAVPNQLGNWEYGRAGWCPGAFVYPWVEDISSAIEAGQELTISYAVEPYVNTCRPDAETCTGCVFGTGCDYNGSSHTPPNYVLSGLLTLYK